MKKSRVQMLEVEIEKAEGRRVEQDAILAAQRERIIALEAAPSPAALGPCVHDEIAALVEAACGERDQLVLRLAREIAVTAELRVEIDRLRAALVAIQPPKRVERYG